MPLTQHQREELLKYTAEFETRQKYKFKRYFPDCKPDCVPGSMRNEDHVDHALCRCGHARADHRESWEACLACSCKVFEDYQRCCRVLYPKHIGFMAAGSEHRERLFLAGNRVGKTDVGAFEMTCHLTGYYPGWWAGRRFDRPVRAWAAGDTMLSTRDVLQVALLGPVDTLDNQDWSGMLPKHLVHHTTRKTGGVSKCIDQIWVRHISGKTSSLEFKSYDQGRRMFQGTEVEICWLDEECPEDVYAECLTRTMTTQGLIVATLTPLQGLTPFIQQYLQTAVMLDADGTTRPAYHVFYPGDAA